MKARSALAQSALAAPEAAWAEAVRREAVVRPLAGASRLGKTAVAAAARKLGLSVPRVYGLLRTNRAQCGARRQLSPAIEARIDVAAKPRRRRRPIRDSDAMLLAAAREGEPMELLAVVDVNDLRQPVGRPRQINTTHATSALYSSSCPRAATFGCPMRTWDACRSRFGSIARLFRSSTRQVAGA